MSVISITTDFGTRDGFVGVMKGVILGIAPDAKIVDISHEIAPQNIHEAAFIVARQVFYFPEDSVHIVVVDPGVGTQRRPIAVQIGGHFFVGPDNSVFSPLYLRAEQEGWSINIVHTNRPDFWLNDISHVFHGRDIFSPVGAHLATGVLLEDVGTKINDPVRFEIHKPHTSTKGITGEINHIDHFGNLISNITINDMAGRKAVQTTINNTTIKGMVNTFGDRPVGELIVLYSSNNYLTLSEVNGNAADRIRAKVGDRFEVITD